MNNVIAIFAIELKEKFPIERSKRYDTKYIHLEIDRLTKEYLNKKCEVDRLWVK